MSWFDVLKYKVSRADSRANAKKLRTILRPMVFEFAEEIGNRASEIDYNELRRLAKKEFLQDRRREIVTNPKVEELGLARNSVGSLLSRGLPNIMLMITYKLKEMGFEPSSRRSGYYYRKRLKKQYVDSIQKKRKGRPSNIKTIARNVRGVARPLVNEAVEEFIANKNKVSMDDLRDIVEEIAKDLHAHPDLQYLNPSQRGAYINAEKGSFLKTASYKVTQSGFIYKVSGVAGRSEYVRAE